MGFALWDAHEPMGQGWDEWVLYYKMLMSLCGVVVVECYGLP